MCYLSNTQIREYSNPPTYLAFDKNLNAKGIKSVFKSFFGEKSKKNLCKSAQSVLSVF